MSEWLQEENKFLFGIQNQWLVILLVFVVFFTGIGAGLRARTGLPSGQDVIDDILGPVDPGFVPSAKYVHELITIDFEIDQSDWQAGGTATPTTPVYSYFYEEPSDGDTGVGITVAGEDLTIKASNDGIVWLDVYGGTDFYLVDSIIRGSNPEVVETKIVDWDGDDTLDFLVKLDLSRFLKSVHQYKPTYVMELPLLDVDVAGLDDNDPANIESIGTAQVTVTMVWTISGVTAEDGYAISELWVVTNDTAKGVDVTLKTMTLSGGHTIVGHPGGITLQPEHTTIGATYAVYYIRPSDADEPLNDDALIIFRDTNMGDTMYFSLNVQCNFEATDDISLILYYTLVSPDGTMAEETDQADLQETA